MTKSKIKAVLFDYDGTIVDTESIGIKIYPIAFKDFGLKFSRTRYLRMRAAGNPLIYQLHAKWYGNKLNKQVWAKLFSHILVLFDDYVKTHPIKLKKGALEIFKYLKKRHIPIVIVSATGKDRIEKQMKELGIYQYPSSIFSTLGIKNGKPKPDCFLSACKSLNLDPKETIAVEDSPNGVISASLAGCNTVMVPDLTQPTKQLKKTYKFKVVKSLDNLKKLV